MRITTTTPLLLIGSLAMLCMCAAATSGPVACNGIDDPKSGCVHVAAVPVPVLEKRQDEKNSTAQSSGKSPSNQSKPPATPATSPTPTSTTSTTPPSADKPIFTSPSTTTTATPPADKPTSTSDDKPTKATKTTASSLTTQWTSTAVITRVVVTQVGGQTVETTMVQTSVGTYTTVLPGLVSGDGSGGNSGSGSGGSGGGLPTTTKNTIIGVVVGLGCAVILSGLGLVLLRVRRKKKAARDAVDADDLMRRDGSPLAESRRDMLPASATSDAASSPFQTTLDQYHKPVQVNAASNF